MGTGGTAEDLLADARKLRQPATARLITDWVSVGLLDHPQRRSRAQGRGSHKAIYSAHQRQLFAVLLDQRARTGGRVSRLTSIPIAVWAYWGDQYVPLRQARRALLTWLDAHRLPPKRTAEAAASGVISQFAHPEARDTDLTDAHRLLHDAIYNAKIRNESALTNAIRKIFDPHNEGRVLGPPAVPVVPEALVRAAVLRETAIDRVLRDPKCLDDNLAEMLARAQQMLRADLGEYLAHQPALAEQASQLRSLFDVPRLDEIVNAVVPNLLLVLGAQLVDEQPAEASR